MKTIVSLVLLCLMGCATKPVPTLQSTGFTASQPTLEGFPTFDITFTRQLTQERVLKITAISDPWIREDEDIALHFSDQLQQANGNWVIFDCDHIADRIIDANLVKEITPYCAEGHELGRNYWKQRNYVPQEFADSMGNRWKLEGTKP